MKKLHDELRLLKQHSAASAQSQRSGKGESGSRRGVAFGVELVFFDVSTGFSEEQSRFVLRSASDLYEELRRIRKFMNHRKREREVDHSCGIVDAKLPAGSHFSFFP